MSLSSSDIMGIISLLVLLLLLSFLVYFMIRYDGVCKLKKDEFMCLLDEKEKLLIHQYRDATSVNCYEVFTYGRRKKDKKTK